MRMLKRIVCELWYHDVSWRLDRGRGFYGRCERCGKVWDERSDP